MTSALRWAAMRAILMFQEEVMDKVTRQCPQATTFFWRERRAEAVSNRGPSAYQPNALPLGQTCSGSFFWMSDHPFIACFLISPKWCADSAIWLLNGWCHVKLLAQVLCTPYSYAPVCSVTSFKAIQVVRMCFAVSCHLHFWQHDRDLLRATAVTRGGTDTEIKVCGNSNPGPFGESGALNIETPLPLKH